MRIKYFSKLIMAFMCLIIGVFLCSCTEQQITTVVTNYGHDNAYNQYSGMIITLQNNTASYYIYNVSGDYRTSASWAIAKANDSSSQLTITASSSSTSNFRFYSYSDTDLKNAYNSYSYYTSTAEIYKSYIYLNTNYLSQYTLDAKKDIAVHEMGHTLGLKDINESVLSGYTIMWYQYGSGITTFTDYQDFDIENIHWQYGE